MAITRDTYSNTGDVRYDIAIDGIPFLTGQSDQYPYVRDTGDWLRDTTDDSDQGGEQSLAGWWYRTQTSFHLGAGITYYEPSSRYAAETLRFLDSLGVDVWSPGVVTLLHTAAQQVSGSSADSYVPMWTYDIGGPGTEISYESGVIFATDDKLLKVKSDGTFTDLDVDTNDTPIRDLVVTAAQVYFCANGGSIYNISLYDDPGDDELIWAGPDDGLEQVHFNLIKDRFILGRGYKLYELAMDVADPPQPLPDPHYEHPLHGWRWTCSAGGPDSIFVAGYRGHLSSIYSMVLETSEAGAVPTLSSPFSVCDMPQDERIYSMISYLGTYLILGTDLGVRVCVIGDNGQVTLGPLSIETETPVKSLFATGKYVYATGSTKDSKRGLYRLDLSNPIDPQELKYPWARDIYHPGSPSGEIMSVCELGTTGRAAFAVAGGDGVYFETSTYLDSGYLETGKIAYNTWELKQYDYLKVAADLGAGTITPAWKSTSTYANLDTMNTTGSYLVQMDAANGQPQPWITYKFTLAKSGSTSPRFQGYQLRANPSGVKPRDISLVLMCFPSEQPANGRRVDRSTWGRITALEGLEKSNEIVNYQDFNTGETRLVKVDRVRFVSTHNGETHKERANPGGLLLVSLRTVD